MAVTPTPDKMAAIAQTAGAVPGLRLLVLHGSRARGDSHSLSDWDLAYEGEHLDADALLAALADTLKVDRLDLVNLDRVGALLRHRVARDGVALIERPTGRFLRFRLEAARTWCDLAPVLEPLYEHVLEGTAR